jgi:hypothetical protein
MILHLGFNQTVKLTSISFGVPSNAEECPKTIKIFANKNNMGFDEANGT